MTTGIVVHDAYLDHEQHPLHPERRERLRYTLDQITEEGLWDDTRIIRFTPHPAKEAELLLIHEPGYLNFLKHSSISGGFIDQDTIVPKGLWEGALLAAGGAITAGEVVHNRVVSNAFALVRPPGHHAKPWTGAGFCYLNNVAILVRSLQKMGYAKVLILDWDAHHGDGTQVIFYDDPSVLFISIHERPLYPGTGDITEIGSHRGEGYTVNIPVPHGTTDDSYQLIMGEIIIPLALEFKPDFIVVSAGQDNHYTDPITGLALTAKGYAWLMQETVLLSQKVCKGRLVAVLEGGYSIEGGLPYINLGIIAAMAGIDIRNIREPSSYLDLYKESIDPEAYARVENVIADLKKIQQRFWTSFSIK